MKTIDRYIFKELMKMFLISIGATTMLLYLDKFLFLAEMIISRGVSFLEVIAIMVFISPAFLALTIPMSVLISSVVVFNQFSSYNEWVAMKGCSLSFLQLMKPVFIFSLLTYALANAVMFYALPWGNQSYKILIFDIIQNRANLDIKANVFNRDFKDLVLMVREKDENSLLKGIFIADQTRSETPQIISAKEGMVFSNRDALKIQLKLKNGTIHKISDQRGDYHTLNFDRYDLTLALPDTDRLQKEALVGNRELSLSQLLKKIDDLEAKGLKTSGPKVELSKKFSIPFTCLIFAIFGAPLGVKSSRSGKSGSFAASIAIIVVYYLGLISTQNLGRIGSLNPYLSVWIPNFFFMLLAAYLIYKMQKELPFKFFDRLIDFLETLYEGSKNIIRRLFPAKRRSRSTRKRGTALDQGAENFLNRESKSDDSGRDVSKNTVNLS